MVTFRIVVVVQVTAAGSARGFPHQTGSHQPLKGKANALE